MSNWPAADALKAETAAKCNNQLCQKCSKPALLWSAKTTDGITQTTFWCSHTCLDAYSKKKA